MAQPEAQPAARPRSHGFGRLLAALAAGVAGGLVAPLIYPAVARGARPAAKKALKAGMAAFERGRVTAAELGERASDLLAETRAEYEEERGAAPHEQPARAASDVVALRGPAGREAAGT
jgi:hypothetical protein